ncbi:hypothetical protein BH10ACI3_BH10ACI3_12470 [soil metagenome]
MKAISRLVVPFILIAVFLSSVMPCGPGYITPLFDTTAAPEVPYGDYAAGRLGIVKSTFRRSVLYAAYRYIAGSGMNRAEQDAMVEVWKAEIDNKDFRDDTVDVAVNAWVEKRKDVVDKDEKTPEIYAERAYGGYDFFPNCTKNAFETATETLADRVSNHGPSDPSVKNWLEGQDQVFQNCASGKQAPEAVPPGAPDWLQKDRAYQIAAASFYSLDYNDANRRFAEIAQDSESPWAETADYLVARTLIRQASLSKTPERATPYYEEAESHLQKFISRSGKFAPSSERLLGLIKYRLHPKERTSELAKSLSFNGGNENFRQDVIDYNWLLDKYESEVLTAEEKRKQDAENAKNGNSATNTASTVADTSNTNSVLSNTGKTNQNEKKNEDDLEINLYSADGNGSWKFYVRSDATDADALAEAERVIGHPLSDEIKKQVVALRQSAYANRFSQGRQPSYEGGYWGEEKMTPSLLPAFLRQDDLTDWLFTFQMKGPEAYLYSLNKFTAGGSELWLMTALSQADKSSTQLPRLLEAANNTSRTSPGYPTIAYHLARILLAQGKTADARKLIDEMMNAGDDLPLSARNSFIAMRLTLAETLEDFLKYSLKKPFAFDFDGDVATIDQIIAEQKSYYDPESNTEGREAYEAEVDKNFQEEKMWQDRLMFDTGTVDVFNQHFPTASLIEVLHSPALPEYMRARFAIAIWTRAYLLDDLATLQTITPEVAKTHPEFEPLLAKISDAKTQPAMDAAVLYFVLKNPLLSPYLEDGFGKDDNEQDQWSSDDWWCEPYDTEYNDETNTEEPKPLPKRPAFLTAAQSKMAQSERKRIKAAGDAPKFLAEKVQAWAKRTPLDRRVPEALYIVIQANGWTKYGCGNNEELRDEMTAYLKKTYPGNPWTAKLLEDEKANQ